MVLAALAVLQVRARCFVLCAAVCVELGWRCNGARSWRIDLVDDTVPLRDREAAVSTSSLEAVVFTRRNDFFAEGCSEVGTGDAIVTLESVTHMHVAT